MLCRGLKKNGMVRAWHGRGMVSVNQTRPHCVNQMGKTHSKPLTARHGRGTAWAWHVVCESAFRVINPISSTASTHGEEATNIFWIGLTTIAFCTVKKGSARVSRLNV